MGCIRSRRMRVVPRLVRKAWRTRATLLACYCLLEEMVILGVIYGSLVATLLAAYVPRLVRKALFPAVCQETEPAQMDSPNAETEPALACWPDKGAQGILGQYI